MHGAGWAACCGGVVAVGELMDGSGWLHVKAGPAQVGSSEQKEPWADGCTYRAIGLLARAEGDFAGRREEAKKQNEERRVGSREQAQSIPKAVPLLISGGSRGSFLLPLSALG